MDVRKLPKASGELPSISVNASLSKLMASVNTGGRPSGVGNVDKSEFLPSKKFQGSRAGYVFTTGDEGTGYYSDSRTQDSECRKRKQREETQDRPNPEELLKLAEENARADSVLDAKSLKKLATNFEKKYTENLEQRLKHGDDPSRFMNSELDLDESIHNLFTLVNSPELYPIFLQTNILNSLLNLLQHENRDLAGDTCQLLAALTDTTDNEEWISNFCRLADALLEANAPNLILQFLLTLNDQSSEDEASIVFNLLTILDNLMEVHEELSDILMKDSSFMKWLMQRLTKFEFDSIKQLCGELLVELLQSPWSQDSSIIKQFEVFKVLFSSIKQTAVSQGMETEDELEFIENLFDGLCCCCLLDNETKNEFVISSCGIELALEIIKKRKSLRVGALKLIQFATTNSPEACEKLLEVYGLKTVFAFFMGKLKIGSGKDPELQKKVEEISLAIISNLLHGLNEKTGRNRVGAKFVENEFEKCDRLFEFYFIYHARVLAEEAKQAPDHVTHLFNKMESGLATLQQICLIVCRLWETGDKALRQRVLLLLHQKQHTLESVRSVIIEMIDGEQVGENEKQEFKKLIEALEVDFKSESKVENFVMSKEEVKERIVKRRKMKQQDSVKTEEM
eukprot:g7261.t1